MIPLITTRDYFEVAGDVYPITIWIDHNVFETDMQKEFPHWICNEKKSDFCLTNPAILPDHNILSQQGVTQDVPKPRQKRFIGLLIASLLGIGGLAHSEILRHQTHERFSEIAHQLKGLETGIHSIGDELITHIRMTSEWKNQIHDYLHINFDKQEGINKQFVNEIINLWGAVNFEHDEKNKLIEDTRRRIIALAKLTSASINHIVQKVSVINSVLDLMLWTDLKQGKLPAWVLKVDSFLSQVNLLNQTLNHYDCKNSLINLEDLLSMIKWTPLLTKDDGLLLGAMLPSLCSIGRIETLILPPLCIPADDGGFYSMVLAHPYSRVTFNGSQSYKSSKFLDSCTQTHTWKMCNLPRDTSVSPIDHQCGQSLFQGQTSLNCMVKLSHCSNKFSISRVQSTIVVSGDLIVKADGKVIYQGSDLAYVVPLQSTKSLEFFSRHGQPILSVPKTTVLAVHEPGIIPILGSWDQVMDFPTGHQRDYLPPALEISHLIMTPDDLIGNSTSLLKIGNKLIMPKPSMYPVKKISSGDASMSWVTIILIIVVVVLIILNMTFIRSYCKQTKNLFNTT